MSIDLMHHADRIKAAFPGPRDFSRWYDEHYEARHEEGHWYLACRRCDMDVWGLTKHARNYHGDDIEIVPPTPDKVARGETSDEWGRRIR